MSLKSFTARLAASALLATTLALPGHAAVADEAVQLPSPVVDSTGSDGSSLKVGWYTDTPVPDGLKYAWFYRAGTYHSPVSANSSPVFEGVDTKNWDGIVVCVSLRPVIVPSDAHCSDDYNLATTVDRSSRATMSTPNRVGGILTVTLPNFVEPSAVQYEWRRNGKPIAGATSSTYTLAAEDIGHQIGLRVKYTHPYGLTSYGSGTSDWVNVYSGRMQATYPVLSGKAAVGSKATVTPGAWTPGTTFTYQWRRNALPIAGATNTSYTLTNADIAQYIGVEVTGSRPGFNTVSHSALNEIRIPELKLASSAPKLSGTAQVGKKLTVTPGNWTAGATLKTQWLTTGMKAGSTKLVKGATARTYTVQPGDVGRFVWARVSGSKTSYETKSLSTQASQWVVKGNLKAATPKVSGLAKAGKTLTVKPGTWTASTKLKYQWLRNGKIIKKATKNTYKVSSKDAAKKISVKVTGTKSGYTTRSLTSTNTAKVKK